MLVLLRISFSKGTRTVSGTIINDDDCASSDCMKDSNIAPALNMGVMTVSNGVLFDMA